MPLKKLFNDLKECRHIRHDYKILPKIKVKVDTKRFRCFILPTILYVPWVYRHPDIGCGVLEIMWLNFTIDIGEWVTK